MKVAVVCSNGKVGKLVVAEALAAGFEVTGFARGENKSEAKNFVQKDIFTLTKEDLAGFDVSSGEEAEESGQGFMKK